MKKSRKTQMLQRTFSSDTNSSILKVVTYNFVKTKFYSKNCHKKVLSNKTNRRIIMEQIIVGTTTSGFIRSNCDRLFAQENCSFNSNVLEHPYIQQNLTSVTQNITVPTQSQAILPEVDSFKIGAAASLLSMALCNT